MSSRRYRLIMMAKWCLRSQEVLRECLRKKALHGMWCTSSAAALLHLTWGRFTWTGASSESKQAGTWLSKADCWWRQSTSAGLLHPRCSSLWSADGQWFLNLKGEIIDRDGLNIRVMCFKVGVREPCDHLTFFLHLALNIWVINDFTQGNTAEQRTQEAFLPAAAVGAVEDSHAKVTGEVCPLSKHWVLRTTSKKKTPLIPSQPFHNHCTTKLKSSMESFCVAYCRSKGQPWHEAVVSAITLLRWQCSPLWIMEWKFSRRLPWKA